MRVNVQAILSLLSDLYVHNLELEGDVAALRTENQNLNAQLLELRSRYNDAVSRIAPSKKGIHGTSED